MDKRKKLIKLFEEIKHFCKENDLHIDPRTYLLNKLYLQQLERRVSASLLKGLTRDEYASIGKKFEDRLKSSYLETISISDITSLPQKKVFTIPAFHSPEDRREIYLLSPALVLPKEIEKDYTIHIGYIPQEENVTSPFSNLIFSSLDRETPMEISFQATLFDLLNAPQTTIRPHSFHFLFDEIISTKIEKKDVWLNNLEQLLDTGGHGSLLVKKTFLASPATKHFKQELYSRFHVDKLDIFDTFTQIHFHRKVSTQTESSTVIANHKKGTSLTLSPTALSFNAMLTFDASLSDEQQKLIETIDRNSFGKCKEHFKFFIGMFANSGKTPIISNIRNSARYKSFIRSRDIHPFQTPRVKEWIVPDKETFFQIPPRDQFERPKLLLRYLSVKPVASFDEHKLYFLKDVAALILLDKDVDYNFMEGYLNSNLLHFYYRMMFPHHNKFLKKNFNKLPFIKPHLPTQKIIAANIQKLRILHTVSPDKWTAENKKEKLKLENRINKDIYKVFHLTPAEIALIESEVGS